MYNNSSSNKNLTQNNKSLKTKSNTSKLTATAKEWKPNVAAKEWIPSGNYVSTTSNVIKTTALPTKPLIYSKPKTVTLSAKAKEWKPNASAKEWTPSGNYSFNSPKTNLQPIVKNKSESKKVISPSLVNEINSKSNNEIKKENKIQVTDKVRENEKKTFDKNLPTSNKELKSEENMNMNDLIKDSNSKTSIDNIKNVPKVLKAEKEISNNKEDTPKTMSMPNENGISSSREVGLTKISVDKKNTTESNKGVTTSVPKEVKSRIYDRQFILDLKSHWFEKPEGIPDIIKFVAGSHNNNNDRSRKHGNKNNSGIWRQSGASNRPRRRGRGGRHDAPMNIEIKPLEISENRYVVDRDTEGEDKILRDMNGILNKLTPEKFDNLMEKVFKLEINNLSLLKRVVNAVFEKSLSEPVFSPIYADFCLKLGGKQEMTFRNEKNEIQTFKRLILNRCQEEFEKNEEKEKLNLDSLNKEERTKQEVDQSKQKKRMLGMIRFIGELFIRGLLKVNIMKVCIQVLLGNLDDPVEENIEALCKLLRTVGSTYEKKQDVKPLFKDLHTLTKSKMCSRLRFMVEDIIELRRYRWVSRLPSDIKLTKLKDVHKQDNSENLRQQRGRRNEDRRMRAPPPTRPGKHDRYGSDKRNDNTSTNADNDGFISAGKKNKWKSKSNNQDPLKPNPADSLPLPKKEANKHVSQKDNKINEKDTKKSKNSNRGFGAFDLLNADDENDHNNEAVDDNNHVEASEEIVPTREEVSAKILSFIKEYFSIHCLKEAHLCAEELGTDIYNSEIVARGLDLILDRSKKEVDLLKDLFIHFFKKKVLKKENFEEGFSQVLEFADDLMVDTPLLLNHLATLMAPLFVDGVMSLSILNSSCTKNIVNNGRLAKLSILIFEMILKLTNEETLNNLVIDAKLDLGKLSKNGKTTYLKNQIGLESLYNHVALLS